MIVQMRLEAGLALLSLALARTLIACAGAPDGALARGAADPVSVSAVGSPPTPLATDWKGLFDSDLQENNAPPAPDIAAKLLRQQPSCSQVDAFTEGAFTSPNNAQTAYLVSCGTTKRVVIADDKATLATLDVSEDVLGDAGDLDLDGRHKLGLYGHAGPVITVRVLRFDKGQLSSIYAFSPKPDPCMHAIVYYR